MADVDNTQIDAQFGGETSSSTNLFAEDVFDQAIGHFGAEPLPIGTESVPPADDETDPNLDPNVSDENVGQADETQKDSTPSEPEFKPYSFKGSVFGQEIEKAFETPDELNKIISRGLASETLYRKMKEKDTVIESMSRDAESGREFEALAKENPEALLDLIFEKYMDETKAAEKVLKLFEHHRNLARMTPEQREEKRQLDRARKIIEQQEALERAQKEAEAKQVELREQQRKVEDKNWANFELKRYQTRFQNLDSEIVKQQILNVMTQVRLQRQQGYEVTQQQATRMLAQYMKPFEKLTSPAETKRRLGEAINQKKSQSADSLGNAARQQIQRQTPAKGAAEGPIEPGDAFDIIKERVLKGKVTLRP